MTTYGLGPAPSTPEGELERLRDLAFTWIRRAAATNPDFVLTLSPDERGISIDQAGRLPGDPPSLHGEVRSNNPAHVRDVVHPALELFKHEFSWEGIEPFREAVTVVETERGGLAVKVLENPDGSLTVKRAE